MGRGCSAGRRLSEARAAAAAAERDREWLEHAAGEIAALAPEAGEETRLAEERAGMQAAAKAEESLVGLDELLGGSEGALAQLGRRQGGSSGARPIMRCWPKRWPASTGR